MSYNLKDAGRYRANPDASEYNTLNVIDEDAPGTPQTDSLVIDTSAFTGGEVISGITYTGRSTVAEVIPFTKQQRPDAQEIPYSVTLPVLGATFDPAELRAAIFRAIERRECDSVVKVAYVDGDDEITVTHTGSGTLSKLTIDGAPVGTNTRAAITIVAQPLAQAKAKAKPAAKVTAKPKAVAVEK